MPRYLVTYHPFVVEATDMEQAKNVATFAQPVPEYHAVREVSEEDETGAEIGCSEATYPEAFQKAGLVFRASDIPW